MTAAGASRPPASLDDLARRLEALDGRGYKAYREIRGVWRGADRSLRVDRVQGDPFATPSIVSLVLPPETHGIPDEAWSTRPRAVGLCDQLLRTFRGAAGRLPAIQGSGKSGQVIVSVDSPAVIARAGCSIGPDGLELRFRVGLPARGRRCLGRAAARLVARQLPETADAVCWDALDQTGVWRAIHTTEDHQALQERLAERDLVGFIRDGAVLPRRSGVSDDPLEAAVPFHSPGPLRVTLEAPNAGAVRGLGLPRGVTVVTGGGFHGKTTLLQAIQEGVSPHVPGDGREWCVTVPDAVKVRSEDGRSIAGVDLSPFVADLPLGGDTRRFSTPNASGSTSLAADILESIEIGTSLLLLDEDTCATNLLVRDARMQELVRRETITPLIDRIGELGELGVSTILVTGGGGDYLDVADTVLLMEEYEPRDSTAEAHAVAERHPTGRRTATPHTPLRVTPRAPHQGGLEPRAPSGKHSVRTRGRRTILYGRQELDLSALEQLVDYGQTRGVAALLPELHRLADGSRPVRELVETAWLRAHEEGMWAVEASPEPALPRPQELARALNRLRSLRVS